MASGSVLVSREMERRLSFEQLGFRCLICHIPFTSYTPFFLCLHLLLFELDCLTIFSAHPYIYQHHTPILFWTRLFAVTVCNSHSTSHTSNFIDPTTHLYLSLILGSFYFTSCTSRKLLYALPTNYPCTSYFVFPFLSLFLK